MQFGIAFPRIFQSIWEADPDKGPVRVSTLDVTDFYHSITLWSPKVGTFTYIQTKIAS